MLDTKSDQSLQGSEFVAIVQPGFRDSVLIENVRSQPQQDTGWSKVLCFTHTSRSLYGCLSRPAVSGFTYSYRLRAIMKSLVKYDHRPPQ